MYVTKRLKSGRRIRMMVGRVPVRLSHSGAVLLFTPRLARVMSFGRRVRIGVSASGEVWVAGERGLRSRGRLPAAAARTVGRAKRA